jgi:hypothetical protein
MPWRRDFRVGLLLAVVLTLWAVSAAAETGYPTIEATYPEHERAVTLGRAGEYGAALGILDRLLRAFPGDYPLNRDYILIAAWKGDCVRALGRFNRVRNVARFEPYFIGPVADCAVAQARAGDPATGVAVLKSLLRDPPEIYPLQRDLVLITIWQGDCEAALREYEPLRGRSSYESYFALPVSECLMSQHRPREALTLLRAAEPATEDEAALRRAMTRAELMLRLDLGLDETTTYTVFGLASDSSDQGLREWVGDVEAGTGVSAKTQLYARYLVTRSSDPEFSAGNQDRAAIGVRYRVNERWRFEQEFGTDLHHGSRGASSSRVEWQPRDTWRLHASYTTYAEDIPLRARAADTEATRVEVSGEYHSIDYRWEGRAAAADYDFSDSNVRHSYFANAGYAYELMPDREQRAFVEWYRSMNSYDGAAYFNPKQDEYIGLLHRTDFVFESRYKRHIDHLVVSVGRYNQDGFGVHARWGVRYEQDYDFDQDSAFVAGLGCFRNVYDGVHEYETRFELRYRRRFP